MKRTTFGLMRLLPLLVTTLAVALLGACKPNPERRELQFMPDMYRNPAVKAQEEYAFFKTGLGMLVPPDNTIPRGFTPYPYRIPERELAGAELENPLPRTREVLEIGRKYYNIHCIVCHGVVGTGDGLVTVSHRELGMINPKILYGDNANVPKWRDGEVYHVISMGQGNMPGYAARIDPMHRWAIVHYVRALDAAASGSEDDKRTMQRLGQRAQDLDNPYLTDTPPQLYLGGTK